LARTKIEWADYTFNPWIGCTKVSEGCKNCYAEALSKRAPHLVLGQDKAAAKLPIWGGGAPRRVTSFMNWNQVERWNAKAEQEGVRRRVFIASMADVFEDFHGKVLNVGTMKGLDGVREKLFNLIEDCPALDMLLLTKRPENVLKMVPKAWVHEDYCGWFKGGLCTCQRLGSNWPDHVWIGCTVENQERAEERIPQLLKIPAPVRFVSYEPALGPVDFDRGRCDTHDRQFVRTDEGGHEYCNECAANDSTGELSHGHWLRAYPSKTRRGINWVIAGGESGNNARPCAIEWLQDAREQCAEAGVPFFGKQMGAYVVSEARAASSQEELDDLGIPGIYPQDRWLWRAGLSDKKGADVEQWPNDLGTRQFPEVSR